jgi:hypothetical protein
MIRLAKIAIGNKSALVKLGDLDAKNRAREARILEFAINGINVLSCYGVQQHAIRIDDDIAAQSQCNRVPADVFKK